MTIRRDCRSFWAYVLMLACAVPMGCERGNDEAMFDDDVQVEDISLEPQAQEKNGSEKNNLEPMRQSEETSQVLANATTDFAKIFSDEENKNESDDKKGIDLSLVDEETRKKYADDRTVVAPTLTASDNSNAKKYRLEYKFRANSSLSWNVVHLVRKKVSYGGKETLTQTSSTTFRRWDFLDEKTDGKISARHWIDRMILQQEEDGKEPVDYDSERDVVVPKEIAAFGTEKAVGVALETFLIDPLGVMAEKTRLVAEYQGREGDSNVVVPFPKEEVAVGDVWTVPYSLYLKGSDRVTRPYQVVERFRLEKIDDKFASISFKTTLVSIVDDPVVQGELAERLFTGHALFDRELGLNLRTEMTFDKKVTGAFGFSSYLEYNCQVVEKLIRDENGNPYKKLDDKKENNKDASAPGSNGNENTPE